MCNILSLVPSNDRRQANLPHACEESQRSEDQRRDQELILVQEIDKRACLKKRPAVSLNVPKVHLHPSLAQQYSDITYLLLRLLLHVLRGVSSISLRRLASSPLPHVALLFCASGDGFIANRHGCKSNRAELAAVEAKKGTT
jgi:hypothetical protein